MIAKRVEKGNNTYYQTWRGHTEDSLKILKEFIEKNYEFVRSFCRDKNISLNRFLNSCFSTVYLHDLGKLCEEFQKNIKAGKSSSKYPHAFYTYFLMKELDFAPISEEIPYEELAVLGHHTQLHKNIYENRSNIKKPSFLGSEIRKKIGDLEEIFRENEFFKLFKFDCNVKKGVFPELDIRNEVKELKKIKAVKFNEPLKKQENIKSIFTVLFSILQTCDDYSSQKFKSYIKNHMPSKKHHESVINENTELLPQIDISSPRKAIMPSFDPYKFQKKLSEECPEKGILFAPCGRGKTEGALLWALKALKKFDKNKIIFAMPTQVTSNAMWERLCKKFGHGESDGEKKENGKKFVGLFHGKSFIKQKKETESREKAWDENFKGNIFFKPITISTIDHVLYSSIHGFSQADFGFGNLQNSVIVFDEAHYYEKITIEHLISFYKLLSELKIPHILMTGTLPQFMEAELREYVSSSYKKIKDSEGLYFKPFKIIKKEKPIIKDNKVNEDFVKKVREKYEKNLDQTIILNTVKRSRKVYETLKEELELENKDILLYHSRFMYKDRIKKEELIDEKDNSEIPFILVATQVVEISLDLSADLMYTEIAPPDAIGQRAGRLHRGAKEWKNEIDYELIIYPVESNAPYDNEIMENTKEQINCYCGPCSYLNIKELCDSVYSDYNIKAPTNLIGTSNDFFRQGTLFGPEYYKITNENEEGRSLKIRESSFQKIEVIPYSEFKSYGDKALRGENLVQIPYYLYKNNPECFTQHDKKNNTYIFCHYPYSFEKGFNKKEDCKASSNII